MHFPNLKHLGLFQKQLGITMVVQNHKYLIQNYMHMHIFPEYTLEMHCMCLVTQQVPLDDTCAFGKKFGAERTPKDRW